MLGILQQKGKKGELLASQYLQKKGLQIIEKNWRCRWGEIDLIALQGKKLIFVEVKSRQTKNYGKGLEAVHYSKQQKMLRTALHYLQKHPGHEDYAFAVVSIDHETQQIAGNKTRTSPPQADVEGEAPRALPVEGATQAPVIEYLEFPLDGFNRYY